MESTQETAKDNGQNKTETVSLKDNGQNETEIISVSPTLNFNSTEERARYCVQFFEQGLAPALEHISPILRQVFKDFSHLKEGRGETIMGCKTQEEWSQKYFHRTARAVRYMCLPEEKKEELRAQMRDRYAGKKLIENIPQLPTPQKSPEKRDDFGTHGGALPSTNSPDSTDYCAPVEPERILSQGREPEGFPQNREPEAKPEPKSEPKSEPNLCVKCEELRRLLAKSNTDRQNEIDSLRVQLTERDETIASLRGMIANLGSVDLS